MYKCVLMFEGHTLYGATACVAWTDPGRDPRYAVVDLTRDWIALCTLGDYPAFEYAYSNLHNSWISTTGWAEK